MTQLEHPVLLARYKQIRLVLWLSRRVKLDIEATGVKRTAIVQRRAGHALNQNSDVETVAI